MGKLGVSNDPENIDIIDTLYGVEIDVSPNDIQENLINISDAKWSQFENKNISSQNLKKEL